MRYYPALKQRLTCREAAPRYGLKVNAAGRNGTKAVRGFWDSCRRSPQRPSGCPSRNESMGLGNSKDVFPIL